MPVVLKIYSYAHHSTSEIISTVLWIINTTGKILFVKKNVFQVRYEGTPIHYAPKYPEPSYKPSSLYGAPWTS